MNGLVMGALAALSMFQQQTDTVIPLQDAKLLAVEAPGGTIAVTGWDRSEIRIQADHSHRSYVSVRRTRGGDRISIEADATRGPATIVDFKLMVPRSLALELEGQYTDITVDGMSGAISAESVQGDVTVRGGRGSVKVSSTTGKVLVDGAQGKIEAETAADDIRFVNVQGDVVAESAGGDILFENAHATSVDVGTTGGRISYEGTLDKAGTYYFGAHSGSVTMVVPDGTTVSMSLATVHGSIVTNLTGETQRMKGGTRHKLEVGGGGAIVEIETFAGRIAVMRKGTEGAMQSARDHDRDHGDWTDVDVDAGDWGGDWDVGAWVDLSAVIREGMRVGFEALENVDLSSDIRTDVRRDLRSEWRRKFVPDTLPATIRR